jgi:ATP-dependent helicase HrpB
MTELPQRARPPQLAPLPIDRVLPEVTRGAADTGAVVVEAPPGAGKTTRVPRALLDAGLGARGEIWVLEPRRLPARLAAARVAAELGQRARRSVTPCGSTRLSAPTRACSS